MLVRALTISILATVALELWLSILGDTLGLFSALLYLALLCASAFVWLFVVLGIWRADSSSDRRAAAAAALAAPALLLLVWSFPRSLLIVPAFHLSYGGLTEIDRQLAADDPDSALRSQRRAGLYRVREAHRVGEGSVILVARGGMVACGTEFGFARHQEAAALKTDVEGRHCVSSETCEFETGALRDNWRWWRIASCI